MERPGVGCFHQHHLLYAFPLIPSIMFHRVRQSELRVLLVAPKCPSTVWFPTPCRVLNRDLWQLKRRMDLSCRNIGMAFISRFFSSLTNALEGNLSFLTDLKPLNSAWYDKLSSSPTRRPCQRLWAALSLQYRNCDLDLLYPLQSLHLKVQGIRLCSDSDFLTGLVTQ